ncbi:hypothetical protein HYT33_03015 [Candidatus Roizmanbacteria bacterium]|nr:hypothetical protein [Candidatus Roizmanbacteria bacterium]
MAQHPLERYLHKHTRFVVSVVVLAFLLLAAGEYYLLRQVRHVNRQVSEGFFQIKEETKKDLEQLKNDVRLLQETRKR